MSIWRAAERRVCPAYGGRLEYERTLEQVRAQVDAATWMRWVTEGRGLSREQAIAYALETEQDPWPASLEQGASLAHVAPSGSATSSPHPRRAATYSAGLSAREVEVLRLVAAGLTNARIAEQLVISPRTVDAHLTTIYSKIEVKSRSAATRYALDQQLA